MSKPFAPNTNQIQNPKSETQDLSVPYLDLKAQYLTIKPEIDAAIASVFENTNFILGPQVEKFEKEFAEYVGSAFCVGVNSGTAALQLALMACGIGRGDEVIVPSFTFFATAETVSVLGAVPVFVDVDPASYTISAAEIEKAITPRTRAIIPVHLYGQAVDLDPIRALADKHKLHVIEDAAQAHGAEYKGRRVGGLGTAGCFSFYPSKNLGSYGEAGAVVTNDEDLARQLRLLRQHGQTSKYAHAVVGYNFRLEELQAAVLNVKLAHLDKWNNGRRERAARYNEHLSNTELVLPREMEYARHVYHVYAVQCDNRNELQNRLAAKGIQSGVHYPIPIHLQPAYTSLGCEAGDLPVTERLSERVLSLPLFAELTDAQQQAVVNAIR